MSSPGSASLLSVLSLLRQLGCRQSVEPLKEQVLQLLERLSGRPLLLNLRMLASKRSNQALNCLLLLLLSMLLLLLLSPSLLLSGEQVFCEVFFFNFSRREVALPSTQEANLWHGLLLLGLRLLLLRMLATLLLRLLSCGAGGCSGTAERAAVLIACPALCPRARLLS